jgi:hypothetical protein
MIAERQALDRAKRSATVLGYAARARLTEKLSKQDNIWRIARRC